MLTLGDRGDPAVVRGCRQRGQRCPLDHGDLEAGAAQRVGKRQAGQAPAED